MYLILSVLSVRHLIRIFSYEQALVHYKRDGVLFYRNQIISNAHDQPDYSSLNQQKKIGSLLLIACLFRFFQFIIQAFIQPLNAIRCLILVITTLPAMIFISIQMLLIFFWARMSSFTNDVDRAQKAHWLRRIFILSMAFVYSILIVFDVLLLAQYLLKEVHKEYSIFEILIVSYTAALFLTCGAVMSFYGWRLYRNYNQQNGCVAKQTAHQILFIMVVTCSCLFVRGFMILLQIFVPVVEHLWYVICFYYIVGELLPLSLLLYVLQQLARHQGEILQRCRSIEQQAIHVDTIKQHPRKKQQIDHVDERSSLLHSVNSRADAIERRSFFPVSSVPSQLHYSAENHQIQLIADYDTLSFQGYYTKQAKDLHREASITSISSSDSFIYTPNADG
jgi:hypothetical protein